MTRLRIIVAVLAALAFATATATAAAATCPPPVDTATAHLDQAQDQGDSDAPNSTTQNLEDCSQNPASNKRAMQLLGEQTDTDGLIYLRARQYDPSTGAFTSRDPLEDISEQPYLYANNNPLVHTDPSGLYWGENFVSCPSGLDLPFGTCEVEYEDPNPPDPTCDGKPRSDAAATFCEQQAAREAECAVNYTYNCGGEPGVEAVGDFYDAALTLTGASLVWRGGKWVVAAAAGHAARGGAVAVPAGYEFAKMAGRGSGVIFQKIGSKSTQNTIRIMKKPSGKTEIRVTNRHGEYLDADGKVVGKNDPAGHLSPRQYRRLANNL